VVVGSLTSWIAAISSLSALFVGFVTALWAYTKFIVERGLLPPAQFEIECTSVGSQRGVTVLEIILHLRNLGSSALIATNIRADVRYLNKDEVPDLVHLDGSEKDWAEEQQKLRQFGRVRFPGTVKGELELISSKPRHKRPVQKKSWWTRFRGRVGALAAKLGQAIRVPWRVSTVGGWFPRVVRKGRAWIAARRRGRRRRETRGFSVMAHDTFVQPGVDQRYSFTTGVPTSAAYVLVWASFEYAQSPKLVQRVMLWASRRLGLIQFTLRHVTEPHTTERVFKL
jgi:hypothetical protein